MDNVAIKIVLKKGEAEVTYNLKKKRITNKDMDHGGLGHLARQCLWFRSVTPSALRTESRLKDRFNEHRCPIDKLTVKSKPTTALLFLNTFRLSLSPFSH